MRLFYLLKKLKYFAFFTLLILISIFAVPGYTKGVGEFFSSKAQVTWDDNGLNIIDKRAYIFLNDQNQESKLKYLPGNLETGNLPLDFGHPLLNGYGCRINSPASDYLINPGSDSTYAKGWYNLLQGQGVNQFNNPNLKWGAATVTWGNAADYEKNCEYEYVYLPGSAEPTDNQAAAIEGDIYSQGEVVGETNPNEHYIAIAGNSIIESAADIKGFGPGEVTQAGFYTLKPASTSDKSILNTFKTKLNSFIDEYYNVRYDQTSTNPSTLNKFSKSHIESGPLHDNTELAKNLDGDIYLIKSNGSSGSGDLTIDDPVDLPENARKLVYVEGNLYIKSDINAPSSSTDPDSAVLAFVVEGDIIIDGDAVKDVENIHAGLISLGGTITFKHFDDMCTPNPSNPCRQLIEKGLVIGGFVEFKRDPAKITFSESQRHAGVYIKYNPNTAKLPAFDQLLSAPAIDEASP